MDTQKVLNFLNKCKICALALNFAIALSLIIIIAVISGNASLLVYLLTLPYILYVSRKRYKKYAFLILGLLLATIVDIYLFTHGSVIQFILFRIIVLTVLVVALYALYASRSIIIDSLTTTNNFIDYLNVVIFSIALIMTVPRVIILTFSIPEQYDSFIAKTDTYNYHHDGIKGKKAYGLGLVVDNMTAGIGGESRLDVIVVCNDRSHPIAISDDDVYISMHDESGRKYTPGGVDISSGGASSGVLNPGMCAHVKASFATPLDASQDYLTISVGGHTYYLPIS